MSPAFAVNTGLFPFSGGEITSTFDHPELVKLGHCKLIEEVMIGEDTLIHFSGVDMGKHLHRLCPHSAECIIYKGSVLLLLYLYLFIYLFSCHYKSMFEFPLLCCQSTSL